MASPTLAQGRSRLGQLEQAIAGLDARLREDLEDRGAVYAAEQTLQGHCEINLAAAASARVSKGYKQDAAAEAEGMVSKLRTAGLVRAGEYWTTPRLSEGRGTL